MKKVYRIALKLFFLLIIFVSGFIVEDAVYAQGTVDPYDLPCDAEPLCGFDPINEYRLEMRANNVEGNYPGFASNCYLHDPNWFAFVAGTGQVTVNVNVYNCTGGSGVQLTLYSGDLCALIFVTRARMEVMYGIFPV